MYIDDEYTPLRDKDCNVISNRYNSGTQLIVDKLPMIIIIITNSTI